MGLSKLFSRVDWDTRRPNSALLVGRVGALAVALGIGGALGGMTALASADTGDATGKNTASAAGHAGPARSGSAGSSAAGPGRRPAGRDQAPVSALRSSRPQPDANHRPAPAAAAANRQIRPLTAPPAAAVETPPLSAHSQAAAAADLWLFGDGTAAHPNAGVIAGNGYSWTQQTCPAGGCTGGNGGWIGNGGNGRKPHPRG